MVKTLPSELVASLSAARKGEHERVSRAILLLFFVGYTLLLTQTFNM